MRNEPAFPTALQTINFGLTKREYFAIKIMQGLMSACDDTGEWMAIGDVTEKNAAMISVRAADNLINCLEEEPTKGER